MPHPLPIVSFERLLLLVPFLFATAYAQDTGTLVGRVTDRQDGQGLPGADVVLDGTTLGAATDLDGFYQIAEIPVGSYDVIARLVGYTVELEEDVRILDDAVTEREFELEDDFRGLVCCLIICYERQLLSADVYEPRVILGKDTYYGRDTCSCGYTIDLRSLPVGR